MSPVYTKDSAHEAMPDHERHRRPLLLCERQELRRKIATSVAFEHHEVRSPEAVEDRKKQQWVFRSLTQHFRLLDERACLLDCRLWFQVPHSL